MKKRDLYFSLHVDRVGIASQQSETENRTESEPDHSGKEQQQEQKAVARVTLTNWENEFVLDTFVAIPVPISDFYETGIRPEDVSTNTRDKPSESEAGNTAALTADGSSCSFAVVRAKVERILRGKILIGYNLDEGLQALGVSHPKTDMRDCSVYFSTAEAHRGAREDDNPQSEVSFLEVLSQEELNRPFQSAKAKIAKDSPNNDDVMLVSRDSSISRRPVQICVTTMDLYKKRRKEWETVLISQARERERQQQDYLVKLSQQRQHEQQQVQQHIQQQQYRESLTPLSIHCETVRTALLGRAKTLARVTIVDGPTRKVLLDEFAQIPVPVTDFCKTGITDIDVAVGGSSDEMQNNIDGAKTSKPLSVLRGSVERLIRGRLVVGFKVEESFKVLGLKHPWLQIRDVAYFPPFLYTKLVGDSTSVVTVRSLDELSEEFLGQKLRPPEDRSRPFDLCLSVLGLYETFRDQWERQPHNQQEDSFARHQAQQQKAHHPPHLQGRMMPPSPSAIMKSQHMSPSSYYGHQPRTATYNAPMVMTPPRGQQLQRQVLVSEQQQQQQQYADSQSRSNSNPTSWFNWGRTQTQQPQQLIKVVGASQTLSSQAFQFLHEAPPSPPKNHFLPVGSNSVGSGFAERRFSYDGSTYGSEVSAMNSDAYACESVVSSIHDEVSSVFSGDQVFPNPPASKSTWFPFGSKRSKDPTQDDLKSNCDTMTAVRETRALTDDEMLPKPKLLFPPSTDSESEVIKNPEKIVGAEPKGDGGLSDIPTTLPQTSRSWFGFRKSPVPKDRPHSPSSSHSESTFKETSITAQPKILADTANEFEITLSMPTSAEVEDTIAPLAEKSENTNLQSRPSSSWFGFRRSSKSSGSECNNSNTDCLAKDSNCTEDCAHPGLAPAPTERTAVMDDNWLQEVMSQSIGTTQDLDPWMNGKVQTNSGETAEKPSNTSRGQASWFGFKRSKGMNAVKTLQHVTSLDGTRQILNTGYPSDDDAWSDGAATGGDWLPEERNESFPTSTEHGTDSNISGVFHNRARLPTESTIPSVATDEDECTYGESFSKDLDFGAAQSFNFLKI